jgi:energy-converting hydrogenase Eha subunit G
LVLSALVPLTNAVGLEISSLIPLGFVIGFVCMLVLVFSENSLFMLIAGIVGTVSSFLLVGGLFGGIGGILGIVGAALMTDEPETTARSEFLAARERIKTSTSPLTEQHSIRCPTCGYLNKADSVYCGKCRGPLRLEEDSL